MSSSSAGCCRWRQARITRQETAPTEAQVHELAERTGTGVSELLITHLDEASCSGNWGRDFRWEGKRNQDRDRAIVLIPFWVFIMCIPNIGRFSSELGDGGARGQKRCPTMCITLPWVAVGRLLPVNQCFPSSPRAWSRLVLDLFHRCSGCGGAVQEFVLSFGWWPSSPRIL